MKGWMLLLLWSAAAACIALVAGWPSVVVWTNLNSGLASWVQAVGSIVAIGSTAALVQWQHELERKRAREADIDIRQRKLSVIVELVRATSFHAKWLQESLPDRDAIHAIGEHARPFDRKLIASLGAQLEMIPLHELDDPTFAAQVLILTSLCVEMRDKLFKALELHRRMSAVDFANLFDSLRLTVSQLQQTQVELKDRVASLRL